MRRIWMLTLIPVCLILFACASTGNPKLKEADREELLTQIQEGTTTKAEVEALLGPADEVSFTDNLNEIWTYRRREATPHASNFIPIVGIFSSGANVSTKELIVIFDRNDVVARRTMRETTSVVKQGILGKN